MKLLSKSLRTILNLAYSGSVSFSSPEWEAVDVKVTSKSKMQMGILLEEACKGEKETNFLFMKEMHSSEILFSENFISQDCSQEQ